MPSTRSSRAAIKDTDAVKPTDLEGRANANTVTAVEKKGNHRSQRSKASSLVKKRGAAGGRYFIKQRKRKTTTDAPSVATKIKLWLQREQ